MLVPSLRLCQSVAFALALSCGPLVAARVVHHQSDLYLDRSQAVLQETVIASEEALVAVEACAADMHKLFDEKTLEEKSSSSSDVSFVLHRNGEPDACGSATLSLEALREALASFDDNNKNDCRSINMDQYSFESLLTKLLSKTLTESNACSSTDDDEATPGLLGFCDMGDARTPILLDHQKLVPVPAAEGSLPCHFHTREGVRITSMQQLADFTHNSSSSSRTTQECSSSAQDQECSNIDDNESTTPQPLHLYAVPAGRVFMFAPSFVGEIFELPHVQVDSGLPVYLQVLSLSPRVFDIFNFFDKEESDDLVRRALAETSATHRIKRSTTGTKDNSVNSMRTSENGFDTHGKTAQKVKRRCFSVLGFNEYIEGHSDGLQILRYNETNAYISHMDYMTERGGESFNYDSAGKGGNRFATILLYMSDLEEGQGGETVFTEAWPPELPVEERKELSVALEELRASGDATSLKKGSWEERLAAQCRTKLSVRPNSARAVLFYSQLPNGRADPMSKHGACPILKGEKWAANLWVWNTPRENFEGAPIKPGFEKTSNAPAPAYKQLKATFRNDSTDPKYKDAKLYFNEEGYWGELGNGKPALHANTYEGHQWNVKVGDEIVQTWVISAEDRQEFVLK